MSISPPQTESRIVPSDVSWNTFQALLADMNRRGSRFSYNRGMLEITSPSFEHERISRLIGRMIETYTEEPGISIRSARSTTLKDELKQRGLEPDESYYIANEDQVVPSMGKKTPWIGRTDK
jgi:Uma2 family endonuclease